MVCLFVTRYLETTFPVNHATGAKKLVFVTNYSAGTSKTSITTTKRIRGAFCEDALYKLTFTFTSDNAKNPNNN